MFCWTRDIAVWKSEWMTSAQLWSRRHHWPWADVIRADFQTVISRYLHNVNTRLFSTADKMFRTIIMQNSRLVYACFPIKSTRFESTDFASVMIDDAGCSRRHQCPQCEICYKSNTQVQGSCQSLAPRMIISNPMQFPETSVVSCVVNFLTKFLQSRRLQVCL